MKRILTERTALKKRFLTGLSLLLAVSIGSACNVKGMVETSKDTSSSNNLAVQTDVTDTQPALQPSSFSIDEEDQNATFDKAEAIDILLDENSPDHEVAITQAGTYYLSGSLKEGQILVDAPDDALIRLVFDQVDLSSAQNAPIQIVSADKVMIILAENSENYISDLRPAPSDDETDDASAAIYSKDDLTITGEGSLQVTTTYRHGIQCNDDLILTGETILVEAIEDGIRSRDSLCIRVGSLAVKAGEDGLYTNNDEETDQGSVVILDGKVDITAGRDGIDSINQVVIENGSLTIQSGGDWESEASDDSAPSMKGIKGAEAVFVKGGILNIDSADDAIHSNNQISIADGTLHLSSGDDGLHADSLIQITGGAITIAQSYEGIESANISIKAGDIQIQSTDDAINLAGGVDGSSAQNRPGARDSFQMTDSGSQWLTIEGGSIMINANGDGIDANGSIEMSGGSVLIHGPTSDMNGALDYLGSFSINGGYLVAAGSVGMAQAPDQTSSQLSFLIAFDDPIAADTLVYVNNESGETLLSFVTEKETRSLVVSTPELQQGETVTIYAGGEVKDAHAGLGIGISALGGIRLADLSLDQMTTISGNASGGQGPMGGGRPGGGRR